MTARQTLVVVALVCLLLFATPSFTPARRSASHHRRPVAPTTRPAVKPYRNPSTCSGFHRY